MADNALASNERMHCKLIYYRLPISHSTGTAQPMDECWRSTMTLHAATLPRMHRTFQKLVGGLRCAGKIAVGNGKAKQPLDGCKQEQQEEQQQQSASWVHPPAHLLSPKHSTLKSAALDDSQPIGQVSAVMSHAAASVHARLCHGCAWLHSGTMQHWCSHGAGDGFAACGSTNALATDAMVASTAGQLTRCASGKQQVCIGCECIA